MNIEDVLKDYSFHDSVITKIFFNKNVKGLFLYVQMPKRDFSDTFLNCSIEYTDVIIKEINKDLNNIDWDKTYGSVLNYQITNDDITYFIELISNNKNEEYLKIIFSSPNYTINTIKNLK